MISGGVELEELGKDARINPWIPSMVILMGYVCSGISS